MVGVFHVFSMLGESWRSASFINELTTGNRICWCQPASVTWINWQNQSISKHCMTPPCNCVLEIMLRHYSHPFFIGHIRTQWKTCIGDDWLNPQKTKGGALVAFKFYCVWGVSPILLQPSVETRRLIEMVHQPPFLIERKHWQGIVNDNCIMMAAAELLYYYVFITVWRLTYCVYYPSFNSYSVTSLNAL